MEENQQVQPQQAEVPVPQTPAKPVASVSSSTSKTKYFLLGLLILIILLILSVWIYYSEIVKKQRQVANKVPSTSNSFIVKKAFPTVSQSPIKYNTFVSKKLGISFSYISEIDVYPNFLTPSVSQSGNTAWLVINYEDHPQATSAYVQVFKKGSADSLSLAITKIILTGYSVTDCPIKVLSRNQISSHYIFPQVSTYTFARIDVPMVINDKPNPTLDKCPAQYTWDGNNNRFFVADSLHPDIFIFVSDNQYGISGGPSVNNNWTSTIRFINKNQ